MAQPNLFTKQKEMHTFREQTYGYRVGRRRGRDSQGVWDGRVHTAVFKVENQQGPTGALRTLLDIQRQPG